MPQQRNDVQYLLDRAEIHDVIARYFQALDRGEPDGVRNCFTADVQAVYDERPRTQGIDALMGGVRTFRRIASGEMKLTTHFMGNFNISRLEGDVAETETNTIAFLVLAGKPDRVAMRSLRYLDRLRRTPEGWKISERQHTLDWSCELEANYALTMAQRILAWPQRIG